LPHLRPHVAIRLPSGRRSHSTFWVAWCTSLSLCCSRGKTDYQARLSRSILDAKAKKRSPPYPPHAASSFVVTEVITESRDAGFLTVDVQQAGVQCKSPGSIWSAAEGLPRDLRCLPWGTSFVSGTAPYWLPALGYSVGPTFGPQTMRTHESAGHYSIAGGISPNSWTAFQEVMLRWTSSVLPARIFAGGLFPNRDACPPGPLEGHFVELEKTS